MFIHNLNEKQQQALLSLANELIYVDKHIDNKEVEFIEIIKKQCTIGEFNNIDISLDDLPNIFRSKASKVSLLLELIGIANADHEYKKEESDFLIKIAMQLNIEKNFLLELESWVKEQFDLMLKADNFMREE